MQFFLQFAGFASSSFQLYKERPSTIKLVVCFLQRGNPLFQLLPKNMKDNSTAYTCNFECHYNLLNNDIELHERMLHLEQEKIELLKGGLE